MKTDIRVVGNYCHDTLVRPDGSHVAALGGSSSYISSVLGVLATTYEVVARVGDDFLYGSKVAKTPLVSKGMKSTHFEADFRSGERVLTLRAPGPVISPADIHGESQVTLLCGVANEITPETVKALSPLSGFMLADVQGLIRTTDAQDRIALRRLADTEFAPLMGELYLLKASEEEARQLDVKTLSHRTCVAITHGTKGCSLHHRESVLEVPSFPVEEIDPTGAGDCWMAGFAYGLSIGLNIEACARLANFCGAQAVGQVGVPVISPDKLLAIIRAEN